MTIFITGYKFTGKSYLANQFKEEGWQVYSTGDFCRQQGLTIKNFLAQNERKVREFVLKCVQDKTVIDGFPRSESQVKWLYKKLDKDKFFVVVLKNAHMMEARAHLRGVNWDLEYERIKLDMERIDRMTEILKKLGSNYLICLSDISLNILKREGYLWKSFV